MKNNPRNIIQVTNEKDITFNVRIRFHGDNHGRNMSLVHTLTRPVIEFYDPRFKSSNVINGLDLGFFVSSYFRDTIGDLEEGRGIDLYDCEDDWEVSGANVLDIKHNFCQYITIT